jgi:uncharacterized protein YaiI (UPF0178 family)
MRIWVDADACPRVIKEILFRAAQKRSVELILVANQHLTVPNWGNIKAIKVAAGFDVADTHIAQNVTEGELVITADVPLAALVIDNGGLALNPRGELYTENNIRQRLAIRNRNEELRSAGTLTGGPAEFSQADRRQFANELDKLITQSMR